MAEKISLRRTANLETRFVFCYDRNHTTSRHTKTPCHLTHLKEQDSFTGLYLNILRLI